MTEHTTPQEIQKNVLARIRGGAARMHSRGYFIARVVLTAAVALVALALSTLVLSFIFFSLHESGQQFLLGFGARGAATFLSLFPWLPFFVAIALCFLLEWLLQGFKIGYRFSLVSIFLAVIVASTALAVVVNFTPVHSILLDRADRGELPFAGGVYESIRDSHEAQGVFRGTIVSIQGNMIAIAHDDRDHDKDEAPQTVEVPQALMSGLSVGSRVYVLGSFDGAVVRAYGLRALDPDQ